MAYWIHWRHHCQHCHRAHLWIPFWNKIGKKGWLGALPAELVQNKQLPDIWTKREDWHWKKCRFPWGKLYTVSSRPPKFTGVMFQDPPWFLKNCEEVAGKLVGQEASGEGRGAPCPLLLCAGVHLPLLDQNGGAALVVRPTITLWHLPAPAPTEPNQAGDVLGVARNPPQMIEDVKSELRLRGSLL